MNPTTTCPRSGRRLIAPLFAALTLLALPGCAVDKQGNNIQYGLDAGELTAKVVQELQTTTGRAVLRRLPNGQYQIKMYDRNRVIELGAMTAPFVDYVAKMNEYDLISVGDRNAACGNTHKLVQIKGYDIYSWDFNNTAGHCSLPLDFVVEGQSWKITQQVLNADRQTWTWTAGRLATNTERYTPTPVGAGQRPTTGNLPQPNPTNGRYTLPVAVAAPEKKNPFEGASFEATDADAQKRSHATAGTDKKKGEANTPVQVPDATAETPPVARAPRTQLSKIPEGNYTKPSASSETEVAPIHVQLRN